MHEVSIKIGEVVNNQKIVDEFRCSSQGGIRRSHKTNTLVIVSKHVVSKRKPYDDKLVEGVYHYTGMGMAGDQKLEFSQNRTIAESNINGIDMHFFEVFKDGQYIYMGRVKLAHRPYDTYQADENGNRRLVWVFPLKLLDEDSRKVLLDESLIEDIYAKQIEATSQLDREQLKALAEESGSEASARNVRSKTYLRSPIIAEYTKLRAEGKCELCKQDAPFKDRKDKPFLESHHIQWLSKGGPDKIGNTAALCPNCHKRMHVLNHEDDVNRLLLSRS